MDLRAATPEDLPAILAIYNEAVLSTTATADLVPQPLDVRRAWWEAHQREGLPVLVASEGGAVLAWASLSRYHTRPAYRFTVETSIYVAESRRGLGLGRALLSVLVDSARRLDMRSMVAVIAGGNQVSVALHARFGFREVGRLRDAMFKFESWLDVIYMQLSLQAPEVTST